MIGIFFVIFFRFYEAFSSQATDNDFILWNRKFFSFHILVRLFRPVSEGDLRGQLQSGETFVKPF